MISKHNLPHILEYTQAHTCHTVPGFSPTANHTITHWNLILISSHSFCLPYLGAVERERIETHVRVDARKSRLPGSLHGSDAVSDATSLHEHAIAGSGVVDDVHLKVVRVVFMLVRYKV